MRPLEEFLDLSGLENLVIEAAAKGDSNYTAHWLRQYKDVVKMYGYEIDDAKSDLDRNMARYTYNKNKDMYFTFKKEAEEILGERLQL